MAEPLVPRPKFVAPEEGSTVWLVGEIYTSILTGADTGAVHRLLASSSIRREASSTMKVSSLRQVNVGWRSSAGGNDGFAKGK